MPHAQAVPGRVAFAVAGAEHSLPALGMVGLAELLGPILDTWRLRATVKGLRYVPTTLRVRSHATLLATLLAFGTAQAVLALAALGFIGVGLQPPTAELGLMMTDYLPHYEEAPWLIATPVALLLLLVLGMTLLAGDGEAA